jgi:hypothetical protein
MLEDVSGNEMASDVLADSKVSPVNHCNDLDWAEIIFSRENLVGTDTIRSIGSIDFTPKQFSKSYLL